jgi:hypothetical protein
MASVDLNEPVLTGGILNTNFFNGRVLVAEDLTALQTANAQQHQQIGHVLGEGVAWGMNVTLPDPTQPVLQVTRGLALNRKGQAVSLSVDVQVQLVKSAQIEAAAAGMFAICQPPQNLVPTNLDCYLLTISPSSGFQGSAPMTSASSTGFAASCGSRYAVEGAQFSLLPLGVSNDTDPTTLRGQAAQIFCKLNPLWNQLAATSDAGTKASLQSQIAPQLSKFRNLMAHLCFGTDKFSSFAANPFGRSKGDSLLAEYGLLDDLRDIGVLTDCAVPLALVYWTSAGIQFVDMWSVRRPVFAPPASAAWAPLAGRRREVEGLAMFLQFQSQIAGLLKNLSASAINNLTATDYFQYWPPMAFVPIQGARGFSEQQFLTGLIYRSPYFIEGAKLCAIFVPSYECKPIDLTSGELIWTYLVRENIQAIDNAGGTPSQEYLVFASGHTPFEGKARFDINRWNYANFY